MKSSVIYTYIPIEELHLNSRAQNALLKAGITTLGQLFEMTFGELLNLKNVGAGTLGHMLEASAEYQDYADLTARVEKLEAGLAKLRGKE